MPHGTSCLQVTTYNLLSVSNECTYNISLTLFAWSFWTRDDSHGIILVGHLNFTGSLSLWAEREHLAYHGVVSSPLNCMAANVKFEVR